MGLIGFVFEIVVLACIVAGLACNAAVVGSCNLVNFVFGGSVSIRRVWQSGETQERGRCRDLRVVSFFGDQE